MSYLITALAAIALSVGSVLFVAPALPQPDDKLGAALPSATAVFETSLAAPISSSATSMTLTANAVRGGGSISGYNCFTIDEGSAQAETVCGTVSSTAVTSMTRGISQATGTTTDTDLQFAHRRGANVKITDFPLIQILKAQNNGEDTFANPLKYDAALATTTIDDNDSNLVNVGLLNYVAFNGAAVIDATTAARGVGELATGAEAAASTASGSSGVLLLPASLSTSTWNSATAINRVIVTGSGGKIDDNFIATSTLFATSSIAQSPISMVGKNVQAFTSTGTTTFSVPTGITKVKVTTVGAGGAGGGADAASTDESGGAGGGAGGCAIEWIDISGTSTIQVFVGTGGTGASGATGNNGTWSTFGTNGFYNSASGGVGGGSDAAPHGGAGGTGSGGTLNISGGGGSGGALGSATSLASSGAGGSSCMGGGAPGLATTAGTVGTAGGNYGGAGSGAVSGNGSGVAGGAGANGMVLVEW